MRGGLKSIAEGSGDPCPVTGANTIAEAYGLNTMDPEVCKEQVIQLTKRKFPAHDYCFPPQDRKSKVR